MVARASRRKGRDEEEINEAFTIIREQPYIGKPARTRRGKDMRRLTLERTRYYLYYRVHGDTIEVAVFWHTFRRPPRL